MPNVLSVYRDGALYCQADLTGSGLRIGRGAENDVILEDSLKRVSRLHAVLRLEIDRVILSDLDSANGTIVDGAPIRSIELAPAIPFDIGPYRLSWQVVAKAVAPGHETGVSASIWSQSTAVYQHQPVPAPAGDHPGDTTSSTHALSAALLALRQHPITATLAAGILVGGAYVAERLAHRGGVTPVDSHQPFNAPAEAIPHRPANPTPPAPAVSVAASRTPPSDPPPPAETASAPVTPGVSRTAGTPRRNPDAKPEYPLLAPRPGESRSDAAARSRRAHETFLKAQEMVAGGNINDGLLTLQQLLAEEPRYPGADGQLQLVREQAATTGRELFDAGRAFEAQEDWNQALSRYEEARALAPPNADLDNRIRQVREHRRQACETQTRNAMMFVNYKRWPEGRSAAEKALASCETDTEEYRTAKSALAKIPE